MTTPRTSAEHDRRIDRVHGLYQFAFLFVDFAAALLFVIGSVLFFFDDLMTGGTWMFLVGSVFFAVKPTLRLARFLHLRRLARLAERSLESILDNRQFY